MKSILISLLIFAYFPALGQREYYGIVHNPGKFTQIKDNPSFVSDFITSASTGDTLEIIGFSNGYWKVVKNAKPGYISELFIKPSESALNKKAEWLKNSKKADDQKNAKKHEDLVKKFGKYSAERIAQGQIWIGMTDAMTIESIGRPDKINRTTTASGGSEQWIYPNKYLYFREGKLTTIQD